MSEAGACAACTLKTVRVHAPSLLPSFNHWPTGDLSFSASASLASPRPVPLLGGLPFVALAAGRTHACGLVANGSAFCMGSNAYGALGVGPGLQYSLAPVPVDGGNLFAGIAAGYLFTCGQDAHGKLLCWGRGDYGQLADQSTGSGYAPRPAATAYRLAGPSAGQLHACAINTTAAAAPGVPPDGGAAICWG